MFNQETVKVILDLKIEADSLIEHAGSFKVNNMLRRVDFTDTDTFFKALDFLSVGGYLRKVDQGKRVAGQDEIYVGVKDECLDL